MFKGGKLGCAHPKVVRRRRRGLLDALMFRLGRYPWTCDLCGCRLYFKARRPGGPGDRIRTDTDPRFGTIPGRSSTPTQAS